MGCAPSPAAVALAQQQFDTAGNMTDRSAALAALIHGPAAAAVAERALQDFYRDFEREALVISLKGALESL